MLCWSSAKEFQGPPSDVFLACAAGPVGDKVYLFGGYLNYGTTNTGERPIDVHVFNTVSLQTPLVKLEFENTLDTPSGRCGHTAVLLGDIVYLWGGANLRIKSNGLYEVTGNTMLDKELYAFDVNTQRWSNPWGSGTVPEAKYFHSACVLGKVMYVHGGYTWWTKLTNDMYKLDTSTMVWSLVDTRGTTPPFSCAHSATIIGTEMFVFGGRGPRRELNYIRVFDTETRCWLSMPSAQLLEAYWSHSAFAYKGKMYLVRPAMSLNEIWILNPKTLSFNTVEPTGYCLRPQSTGCMVADRIIFFGKQHVQILHLSPSLKTLCELAVIRCGLDQSGLPHNIRWELAAMTGIEQQKNIE